MTIPLQILAPHIWLLSYPLKTMGVNLQRNVTLIRLDSGQLIIHSTAAFSPEDVAGITALGEPTWMLDALLRHDTFAQEAREAFPDAEYLAPEGFSDDMPFSTANLLPPPNEWEDEIAVAAIQGAPDFSEIAMLHRASGTLIVADLIVNFPGKYNLWERLFFRIATVGGKHAPGVTFPFKKAIEDQAAYAASIEEILDWDFDRVIVGHGKPIATGGKEKLRTALKSAGIITPSLPSAPQTHS